MQLPIRQACWNLSRGARWQGEAHTGSARGHDSLSGGKIRCVDSVIEEWFEKWRQGGLLEHTLLIITSGSRGPCGPVLGFRFRGRVPRGQAYPATGP